jgi:hypothetical protein
MPDRKRGSFEERWSGTNAGRLQKQGTPHKREAPLQLLILEQKKRNVNPKIHAAMKRQNEIAD